MPYKSDKFGLGFTAEGQHAVRHSRAGKPLFRSSKNGVNTREDADSDYDFDS